jgi:hypothetical protein
VSTETPAAGVADPVRWIPPWLDFVGSQAAWWSCVLLVRADREAAALAGPVLYIAMHAAVRARLRTRLVALAGLAALAGWAGDTILVRTGLLSFPGATTAPWSQPWMAALWAAFAVSLTVSMIWLVRRPFVVAGAFGAVAGPLAYAAGERLDVLALARWSAPAVAAEWAVATPLMVLYARRVVAVADPAGAAR